MAYIYGDIIKIDTTGASKETASQDKLQIEGVEASKKLAEHDLARMEKYKSMITKVGKAKKMDPAVIAAIISRESRAGAALKDGWGDRGFGFGLMQVDRRYHTLVGAWDSEQHVTQATDILIGFIKYIKDTFPGWTPEQCLKGGIASYNKQVVKGTAYKNIDAETNRHDYSNDVVARAQWFKSKGY